MKTNLNDIYYSLEDASIGFFTDSLTWIEQDGEEILEDPEHRENLKHINYVLDKLNVICHGNFPMDSEKYFKLLNIVKDESLLDELGIVNADEFFDSDDD